MRIFLSFNSKDLPFAEAVRVGFSKIAPDAQIFFLQSHSAPDFGCPSSPKESPTPTHSCF